MGISVKKLTNENRKVVEQLGNFKVIEYEKDLSTAIQFAGQYDKKIFQNNGIKHYDLYFLDGSTPSDEIIQHFFKIVENVCITLRKKNKYASLVSVILRDKYFKTYSHQRKLKNPTSNTDRIME